MAARWLAIVVLALAPLAAAPLVGVWPAVGLSGLLLAAAASLLLARVGGWRPGARAWIALVPGLAGLGSLVGAVSAVYALLSVGGLDPYAQRAGLGWAALVLALGAGAAGVLARRRPVAGAAAMIAAGLLGTLAMNLFSINTFYVLAVPLWLVAAFAALATSSPPVP